MTFNSAKSGAMVALVSSALIISCGPQESGTPSLEDVAKMSTEERKALCWNDEKLRIRFAGRVFDISNRNFDMPVLTKGRQTVEWRGPGQAEGSPFWTVCQFPSAVPLDVYQFRIRPESPIMLDDTAALSYLTFRDEVSIDTSFDDPDDDKFERARFKKDTDFAKIARWLGELEYLGTKTFGSQELYYYGGYFQTAYADCDTDGAQIEGLAENLDRRCWITWEIDALPKPRKIQMSATLAIRANGEPQLAEITGKLLPEILKIAGPVDIAEPSSGK